MFEVKGRGLFGEAGTLEEHSELIRMDCFCDVHSVWLVFAATLIHYLKAFVHTVDLLKQEFLFLFKLPRTSSATVLQGIIARFTIIVLHIKMHFNSAVILSVLSSYYTTVKVSSLACAISSALPLEM